MQDNLLFSLDDVRLVRKVSVNIDDFDMYAQEVQRNYLQKVLGDKLYTALNDAILISPLEPRFEALLNGTRYSDGRDVLFRGLKPYLCYLWLHLYMADSSLNITPIGARLFKDDYAENNEASQSRRNARDHYIRSADGLEEPIIRFLNHERTLYPEFAESHEIEQAERDNMSFKVIGKRYTPPSEFFQ